MPYYGAERDYPPPQSRLPGECDWGGCDETATAWRWDETGRRYLPVCERVNHSDWRHVGWHKWKNGAELVWVCSRTCPHPSHEDDEP